MKVLTIYDTNINERHIAEAVDALRDGYIVIYPTDTVYGLGVDALNKKAIENLCRLKGLDPNKNLLSLVCSGLSQASEYVRIDNTAFSTLKNYLPGPFTFVLPASTRLPKIFKNRKTIGLRIPDNAIARRLAEELGNPLLSSSVDIPDADPESAAEPENLAVTYANDVAVVIDGGRSILEHSTIVDLSDPDDPIVLREGIGEL